MATIKDIAKKANVSTATVSYVLNDNAQISKATREKVLKVVEEMNYKRNNIAKSLRTNKTNTIGVIVEDMTVFNSPKIIDGINKYVEEHGFHIVLSNLRLNKKIGNSYEQVSKYSEEINETIDVLLTRQIDGIIYIGEHTRDVSKIMNRVEKPVVYTYCYSSKKNSYSVNYNDKLAAYQATNYLIDLGHQKIAVISGMINSKPSHERLQGYQQALIDNYLNLDPFLIRTGDWEYETGVKLSKELLKSQNRPTAIFAFNDLMAVGVIDGAESLGFNVPDDLSVIGFDNREFSHFFKPQLTTIDLPLHEMGQQATKILIDIIKEKKVKEKSIQIECELIKRGSVMSLNKK
ncbi:LacI family transcriptional regulator [Halanaerobium saccharolyticum]|uniref:LacI family transcriptional regulator n=1 Tax=Halanaerobium saccharolyticum TaxID=43595 RepID=A0A4R7Z514_9FIRM|nr:LacI family DNA-binding transcriptional regulator [Halanaerobium saccharolyticum]RAK08163.1 LacI family transcriptional regulator [Halanaerobium saccharolyticum]TDW04370.1 LacI family transcriptional regulator [Halanaerobium saccharolyticum]TDX59661.1 LacI family transcriptional regulator [Halanaerobium saccharolyticum]